MWETNGIAVSASNFPDPTFRDYVSENFDTNLNGYLQSDEIEQVDTINVSGTYDERGSITSLKGIEYFASLKYLGCRCNQLTSLDISKNILLLDLDCSYNKLLSLDVSKNAALRFLQCYSNQLMDLDISCNTALEHLACSSNQLTNLNLSK